MKILIADDHPLVLLGMRRVLAADGFDVVAATRHSVRVLPLVGRHAPDVALLDVRMPGIDGFGCLSRIRARYPQVKVVLLSMFGEPEQVRRAFDLGACGYVLKSIEPDALGAAIREAVAGAAPSPLFGSVTAAGTGGAQSLGLTDRELTIVKAVARGLANQEIGRELWVTEQTVKFHLTNVYKKLGVANRTEATRWAFARGLADEPRTPVLPVCGVGPSAPRSQPVQDTLPFRLLRLSPPVTEPSTDDLPA